MTMILPYEYVYEHLGRKEKDPTIIRSYEEYLYWRKVRRSIIKTRLKKELRRTEKERNLAT